ncbi:MAG: hypothetical protein [Caudoviricetes sp.]|nr:MAG: hypothetical protein [Caudoviricetes sp.]
MTAQSIGQASMTKLRDMLAPYLAYDLTVPYVPESKGRPRVFRGRGVTPKSTRLAENQVKVAFASIYGVHPHRLVAPILIAMDFYMPDKRRKDWDNLAKLPQDALNGVAYEDDSQIMYAIVAVHRPDDMVPGKWGLRMRRSGDPIMYDGVLASPRSEIRLYQL